MTLDPIDAQELRVGDKILLETTWQAISGLGPSPAELDQALAQYVSDCILELYDQGITATEEDAASTWQAEPFGIVTESWTFVAVLRVHALHLIDDTGQVQEAAALPVVFLIKAATVVAVALLLGWETRRTVRVVQASPEVLDTFKTAAVAAVVLFGFFFILRVTAR